MILFLFVRGIHTNLIYESVSKSKQTRDDFLFQFVVKTVVVIGLTLENTDLYRCQIYFYT